MLTCRQATALMSQEHDRDLTRSERWALRLHVWMCRGCAEFRRQMQVLSQACGRFRAAFDDDPAAPTGRRADA